MAVTLEAVGQCGCNHVHIDPHADTEDVAADLRNDDTGVSDTESDTSETNSW